MKIAFNPSTVAALIAPPNNKDITFDLRGHNIFARGVKFCGTDTNTWRDIKINNVSIGSNILDLRNGSNTTLTNTNGVVTVNSTWRPVVDNLTSDSTTSSLSANQGRILKALIDSKSDSEHTHDDRYVKKSGDTMLGALNFANGIWNKVGDDVYIGDHNIPGVFCIKSANNNSEVGINFCSKDESDNASIWYNNAVKRIYIDKEVAVRNHRLWIQGEGPVGGNNNRLTLVAGMPSGLAYNTSCRGTILYSNGIAFADPYNGNSNSDSGWIRHLETTPNHGILEIAVGDDASNEEIHFRWYNTNTSAETIANDITVPKATGTLALTSDIPTALKNPHALTISLNGTSQGPYDGSAAKNINITPSSIGAATSGHNHDGRYVRYYAVTTLDCNNLAPGLTAAGVSANAAHTNHSAFLYISDVGTPFQIQIPDSSVPYIYKRYYSSGTWSGWFKLNAGYADSAGSAIKLETARNIFGLPFDGTNDIGSMSFLIDSNIDTDTSAIKWTAKIVSKYTSASTGGQGLLIGAATDKKYCRGGGIAAYATNVWGNNTNLAIYKSQGNDYDVKPVEIITITDNLNVGIGITTPAYKLHVAGDIYTTTGFKKNGSSDSYVLLGGGGHKLENSLRVAYASNADMVDGYHASDFASSSHSHNYAANENYGGFTKSGRLPISGFYQSNESSGGGNAPWSSWMHLINCQHSHNNNYALQIAASFFDNNIFKIRVTNNNVNNAWRDIIHSGNIGSQTVANAYHLRINSANTWSTWYWSGQNGQPSWLWGSNDGTKMYVWNPSNFRVAYASSAGNADTVDGYHASHLLVKRGRLGDYNIDHETTFGTRDIQPSSEITISGKKPFNGWGTLLVIGSIDGASNNQLAFTGANRMYIRCAYGSSNNYNTNDWATVALTSDNVASATKLQTPRTIWGQSFDGTRDVSGSLVGTGTITASAAATYDIGSNTLDYRYGYFQWIGAKSNTNLRLAANNSDNQIVLHTNGNVGIGTNVPTQKLDVMGNTFTTGFGIRPYYLSSSGLLPTISPGDGYTYRCLEIGKSAVVSCIIADRVALQHERGVLIKFNAGFDGQIVLLKDLENYGNGNGHFWVMPSGCTIIRSDGSSTYISYNQISDAYDDGWSRFFVYSSKYSRWIEFCCS